MGENEKLVGENEKDPKIPKTKNFPPFFAEILIYNFFSVDIFKHHFKDVDVQSEHVLP